MNLDSQSVAPIVGAVGLAVIVGGAALWFLAPAGRRPRTDRVRESVRQRMQPVMVTPQSVEVTRHAQRVALDTYPRGGIDFADPRTGERYDPLADVRSAVPGWATATVLIPDRPKRAVYRPAQPSADLSAHGTAALAAMADTIANTPAAPGWPADRPDVTAHVGDTSTPGSLAALAAVGPGSLLAPGVPEVTREQIPDADIEAARWAAMWAGVDVRLSAASRAATAGIERGIPADLVPVYRLAMRREHLKIRAAGRMIREWKTGEQTIDEQVAQLAGYAPPARDPRTPAQIKRARKKDNRAKGEAARTVARVDRVLAEVNA